MTVGESMRKCRLEHGMEQKELARKAMVGVTSLGAYERDEVSPTLYNLLLLADTLGVSIDEYIGRTVKRGTDE